MNAWVATGLVMAMLVAGCVSAPNAGLPTATLPDCPGHWHFMLGFYLGNVSLPFDNVSFLDPGATELHWETGRLVHIHPHPTIPRCVPLAESLTILALHVSDDTLQVGPEHGNATGLYPLDAQDRLRLHIAPPGSDWQEHDLIPTLARMAPDGARVLFSYGSPSDMELEHQKASVPAVPSRYLQPDTPR